MKKVYVVSLFGLLLAPLQGQALPKHSVLISVGQASQSSDGLASTLTNNGYTDLSISNDTRSNAWSLGYRYPINHRWSADIQYLDQGTTTPTVQATLPAGISNENAAQDTAEAMPERGMGLSAVALYHKPVSKSGLTLHAGLGLFLWKSERTAILGSAASTDTSNGVSPLIQLGMSHSLSQRVALTLDWQHTVMPDESVDRVLLGLGVSF